MAVQPSSAQSNAPPRQKFPVEGQAALCTSGSNSPLTRRGTRQPNAAPTLCAPVGKYLPDQPDDAGLDAGDGAAGSPGS